MKSKRLKPRQALNKAFLKVKPLRSEIENFKSGLNTLLKHINEQESEEFHKNLISDFLKNTYYAPDYFINTKGRNDMVIHSGKTASSAVSVIIEAKSPTNKAEMLTVQNLNAKAMQELVLYYLRERITHKNLEVKQLIATNIYEWFIFDSQQFERYFAQNKAVVKQFLDFEAGRLADTRTDFFYKEIAAAIIEKHAEEIEYTHFDLRDYEKTLHTEDKKEDNKLIALYKLLSPEHILKLPFTNDSNTLDKQFYSEFLHIIGLQEVAQGGKKLIQRNEEKTRNVGTLLENAILQLDSLDMISRLHNRSQYGDNHKDRLYNVALELTIIWMNRILFLKLLEAQLLSYHNGDEEYRFLGMDKMRDYDDLNNLFFQVLARKKDERSPHIRDEYEKVPYLNSSLFDPQDIEHSTLFISNLNDFIDVPIYSKTVLKDKAGKRLSGELPALEYLLRFLDAYDFGSEGSESIQEDNKTLINASVLGLIFEKINGYKDGSFFTPGFITMYMSRETIRAAVVQKFNETKGWNCESIADVYNKIDDIASANEIVNSLKICDPAVGSGHFLVSALNEVIAVKNDLRILSDTQGMRLKEYQVEVVNDELIITDEDGELYAYNPRNPESQRVQEALFHEKQTIIENCLFGVDINPNSAKICRLRLWIELLKSAYYHPDGNLETLPNIDINIKTGNSLISRFALDTSLKEALKKSKWNISTFLIAHESYQKAKTKEEKREMLQLIEDITGDFRSEISMNDPLLRRLQKHQQDLFELTKPQLFSMDGKQKAAWEDKVKKLTDKINKLESEIEEIKNNKIYEDAFEWRLEFPQVLDKDTGDFIGFDVVIGNPPYGSIFSQEDKNYIKENYSTHAYKYDAHLYFIEKGINLLKDNGVLAYITPSIWLSLESFKPIRELILLKNNLKELFIHGEDVFEEAVVNTISFILDKSNPRENLRIIDSNHSREESKSEIIEEDTLIINYRLDKTKRAIINKINLTSKPLSMYGEVIQGITPYDRYTGQSKEIIKNRAYHYNYQKDETCGKWLNGRDITRYSIKWVDQWLSYGDWLAAPREKRFFEGKRILFREVPGKNKRIQATYTEELYYYGHSVSPFKPFIEYKEDTEYITGIVNSKLISWYGTFTLPNFSKEIFPKLNPSDIKNLPICYNSKFKNLIEKLVKEIVAINLKGDNKSTEFQEAEIDRLVYELYGLTEEEIAVVETG